MINVEQWAGVHCLARRHADVPREPVGRRGALPSLADTPMLHVKERSRAGPLPSLGESADDQPGTVGRRGAPPSFAHPASVPRETVRWRGALPSLADTPMLHVKERSRAGPLPSLGESPDVQPGRVGRRGAPPSFAHPASVPRETVRRRGALPSLAEQVLNAEQWVGAGPTAPARRVSRCSTWNSGPAYTASLGDTPMFHVKRWPTWGTASLAEPVDVQQPGTVAGVSPASRWVTAVHVQRPTGVDTAPEATDAQPEMVGPRLTTGADIDLPLEMASPSSGKGAPQPVGAPPSPTPSSRACPERRTPSPLSAPATGRLQSRGAQLHVVTWPAAAEPGPMNCHRVWTETVTVISPADIGVRSIPSAIWARAAYMGCGGRLLMPLDTA